MAATPRLGGRAPPRPLAPPPARHAFDISLLRRRAPVARGLTFSVET